MKRAVARMERSVIRDCREASMPPRISLRSIRATPAKLDLQLGARRKFGLSIGVFAFGLMRSNVGPFPLAP